MTWRYFPDRLSGLAVEIKTYLAFMKLAAFVCLGLSLCATCSYAQTYEQDILQWQRHYKEAFLEDARSPLKAKDTGFLRFYPVSKTWLRKVRVLMTPDAPAIDMATHAGTTKRYRPYAKFIFTSPDRRGRQYDTLTAFERVNLPKDDTVLGKSLFLPFNDETNGEDTYGGGRYLDLQKSDIKGSEFALDFNKAYNPWCVFATGYSCPIPPVENRLGMRIAAGEKLPGERIRARE